MKGEAPTVLILVTHANRRSMSAKMNKWYMNGYGMSVFSRNINHLEWTLLFSNKPIVHSPSNNIPQSSRISQ